MTNRITGDRSVDWLRWLHERGLIESEQALHDALTQLPNRALIIDRLEQAVARLGRERTRLAALLVDVDRFKSLNDTWGPDVGDEVLIEVSRRLRRSVRLGDTVGRIGGDQFLVLCVANGEGDAEAMAERIVSSVSAPVVLTSGDEIRITSSVRAIVTGSPRGVALRPSNGGPRRLGSRIEPPRPVRPCVAYVRYGSSRQPRPRETTRRQ